MFFVIVKSVIISSSNIKKRAFELLPYGKIKCRSTG